MPGANFYNGKRKFFHTISNDANGDETIKLIVKTINTYSQSPFVQKTVEILNRESKTKDEFFKNLFDVACKNIKYLADEPGHEIIYTPQLLMKMGKGDCKKYSAFIGAVLKAANIEPIVKVVKYNNNKDWEHVYIITKDSRQPNGYITLDPVNHCKYNSEVKYSQARENYLNNTNSNIMNGNKLSMMGNVPNNDESDFIRGVNESANSLLDDLQSITGVGDVGKKSCYNRAAMGALEQEYMNGINDENQIFGDENGMFGISEIGKRKSTSAKAPKTKKDKAAKKESRKKFFHKLKKFAPGMVTVRAAFLSLVKLGGALQKMKGLHINLAKHLAERMSDPVKSKPVLDIWYKFGGEKSALLKAIAQAGKSSMHGDGDPESMLMSGMNGLGVAPAVAAAAVITAATPILIPIIKLMKRDKKISPSQADVIEGGIETAERLATSSGGDGFTGDAIKTFVKSSIVRESVDDDGGGNQATTKDIQQDAVQNESADFKPGTPQGEGVPINESLLPTTTTPGAKSTLSGLHLPTVWIRIAFLAVMFSNIIHPSKTILNTITTLILLAVVYTSINLFINSKNKTNG